MRLLPRQMPGDRYRLYERAWPSARWSDRAVTVVMVLWAIVMLGLLVRGCLSESAHAAATGLATYYTEASCRREGTSGVWTASGERYDEAAFTCALRSRAFGGRYRVCRADDASRCVTVRHNDYGPGRGAIARGVVIDLSPAAFDALGAARGQNRGVWWGEVRVTVEREG
jgi:rare lipoprotein A (peptidoglycan hydrolase)